MARKALWILAAASVVGIGAALHVARAGDDPAGGGMPQGMPSPQKAIKHAFVDCMLGSWTTKSTGMMGEGTGTSTFRLGVGDTCLLHDYEMKAGAKQYFGHGVTKVSDDGKTITSWWIDNTATEPVKMSGPLTEKGFEQTSSTPGGPVMKVTFAKTDKGLEFKMYMGDQVAMTETYTPAPK